MSIVALSVVILTLSTSLAVAAVSWLAMVDEGDVPHAQGDFDGLRFDS